MHTLEHVATHIRKGAAAYCESTGIPGYLTGVFYYGQQTVVAHAVANVVTGMPTRDTAGFRALEWS